MGVVQTFRGFTYTFLANPGFGIVKCIAVDRSGRIPIGTSRGTVDFTYALVCEMKSSNTGSDDARSILANACRGMV